MQINSVFIIYYGFLFATIISFSHVATNRIKIAFYEKTRKDIRQKWTYILSGRSKCDSCHSTINPVYIIPLFGFFLSGGKCRKCHHKISPIYIIEEWLAFGYGALFFYIFPNHISVIFMLFYVLLCYFIANIDRAFFLIPTEALVIFLMFAILEKWLFRDNIKNLILLLSIPFTWYILLHLIDRLMPGRLGLADIHYIAILTFAAGFPGSIYLPTIASFLAIVFFFIRYRNQKWSSIKFIKIPFGMFLSLAYLILKLIPIPDLIT